MAKNREPLVPSVLPVKVIRERALPGEIPEHERIDVPASNELRRLANAMGADQPLARSFAVIQPSPADVQRYARARASADAPICDNCAAFDRSAGQDLLTAPGSIATISRELGARTVALMGNPLGYGLCSASASGRTRICHYLSPCFDAAGAFRPRHGLLGRMVAGVWRRWSDL